jgi:hypothetical protein
MFNINPAMAPCYLTAFSLTQTGSYLIGRGISAIKAFIDISAVANIIIKPLMAINIGTESGIKILWKML